MKRFRQFMKRGKNTSPPSDGSFSSPDKSSRPLKTASLSAEQLIKDAPTALSLSVTSGPTSGGTRVTITGTNFVSGETSVTVGGVIIAPDAIKVSSSTSLIFITPSGSAGNVSVHVTTSNGTGKVPGGFTYEAVAKRKGPSILANETSQMERRRREDVQKNIQALFNKKVNARDHTDPIISTSPEGELQNDIPAHPFLIHLQRFDGIDPNVNPEPPLNSAARTEYDNQRREQEMEKQLRLGLMPSPGAPVPRKPGY